MIKDIDFNNFYLDWHADRAGISIDLARFIDQVKNMNQNVLFNKLIINGYEPKLARRTFEDVVVMKPVIYNWLNGHVPNQAFISENAVYALLLILLGDYFDIGLTVVRNGGEDFTYSGDGGFDIAVKEKGGLKLRMLIDVKSGPNSSNGHVQYLTEMKTPFYRVIMDPFNENEYIGTCVPRARFKHTHVADLTLNHLLSELAFVLTGDLFNEDLLASKEAINKKLLTITS